MGRKCQKDSKTTLILWKFATSSEQTQFVFTWLTLLWLELTILTSVKMEWKQWFEIYFCPGTTVIASWSNACRNGRLGLIKPSSITLKYRRIRDCLLLTSGYLAPCNSYFKASRGKWQHINSIMWCPKWSFSCKDLRIGTFVWTADDFEERPICSKWI